MKSFKVFSIILTFTALAVVMNSCTKDHFPICMKGTGSSITETRTVDLFTKLHVQIPADVYIIQDSDATAATIEIQAQSNLMANLETNVIGSLLEIDFDKCVGRSKKIIIYVTVADLDEVFLMGSGNVYTDNQLVTESLDLNIMGSGDMVFDVVVTDLITAIEGSGDYNLDGSATNNEIIIMGSGNVKAYDLSTEITTVEIAGSGDARVTVSDTLDVHIHGSGNVYFKGDPHVDVSVSGSGNVIDAN